MTPQLVGDTIPVIKYIPVAPATDSITTSHADSIPERQSGLVIPTTDSTYQSQPSVIPGYNYDVLRARADSIAKAKADSLRLAEPKFGVVLKAPEQPRVLLHSDESTGMSVIISGLALLFCVIGLTFRNNRKYITALWQNLTEVRVRTNLFDETVRETSFLTLLNLLWSCSAGIIMWGVMVRYSGIPAVVVHPSVSIAICMGVATVYTFLLMGAYLVCGWVFTDKQQARMWVKGFSASQSLTSFLLLPVALVFLFYPRYGTELIWISAGIFIVGKLMFIWKGCRIFLVQSSSWVLFLYYLCSLEIVPIILSYMAAMGLCSLL